MSYKPDISHYHPVRNWDKVKENCQVLITKATQGTTYIDPTLGAFVANCESRNIPYWLYEYINKGNEQAQTEFFWRVVQQRVPKDSKYFIGAIIDNEAGSAEKNVIKALRWLNDQGKKTMIYTMHTEYAKYRELIATRGNNCAWWEARYGANNGKDTSAQYPCHSGVDLHQYTSHGYCPGIPGSIDLNKIVNKPLSWYTTGTAAASAAPTINNSATLQLVYDVMCDKYGSGEQRKKLLANRYKEVQDFINHIDKAPAEVLAREVLKDKYGSGEVRRVVLGKRYEEVRKIVNQII